MRKVAYTTYIRKATFLKTREPMVFCHHLPLPPKMPTAQYQLAWKSFDWCLWTFLRFYQGRQHIQVVNVTETTGSNLHPSTASWHGYFFASSHWLILLRFTWFPTPVLLPRFPQSLRQSPAGRWKLPGSEWRDRGRTGQRMQCPQP